METVADLFLHAFYALNVAATVFFLHKVLWLVRYKRLQGVLIQEAGARIAASQVRRVDAFDRFAEGVWRSAPDAMGAESLGAYVARVDGALRDIRRSLRTSRASIRERVLEAATSASERAARGAAFSFPRPASGDVREVGWEIAVPPLLATRRLAPELYALGTRSRYGFGRRALVFFAGIADVVYSAQHVAVMSQNPHTPTSLLVRRLSLVVLLLALILADLALGLRKALSALIEERLGAPDLSALGDAGAFASAHFGTIAGVALWTAAMGLIYFAAAMLVRRRSRLWQKRLLAMKAGEKARLASLSAAREDQLVRWLDGFTESLDRAVDLGVRHAALLVDYHRGRLRRRVVDASPVDVAKEIAAALLAELPEASGDLADRATTERRSLLHHLWPREEEMRVEVEMAQMRAAWQDIEGSLARLSSPRPDPEAIDELFRRLVTYTGAFKALLREDMLEELRAGYRSAVEVLVAETQVDLEDLDARLEEIAARLSGELATAGALVRFQVEMANQEIEAGVSKLASDVLATRERARLEAMAFEI